MRLPAKKNRTSRVELVPLESSKNFDVIKFLNNALSITIEIDSVSILGQKSMFNDQPIRIKLMNAGDENLKKISIEAIAPEGVTLVEPGLLFGNDRKFTIIPLLRPGGSITFKMAIRAHSGFKSGDLVIVLRSTEEPIEEGVATQRIVTSRLG